MVGQQGQQDEGAKKGQHREGSTVMEAQQEQHSDGSTAWAAQ